MPKQKRSWRYSIGYSSALSVQTGDAITNACSVTICPREVYERRRWVIEWRKSRLVCKYPKGNIRCYTSYYDKRLGMDTRLNEDLHRLISAKAQVTKVRRKIEEYVAYNRAHNLFFDENTDTDLQKAREKLATKIANVQAAEERMKLKIKQIQEEKQ